MKKMVKKWLIICLVLAIASSQSGAGVAKAATYTETTYTGLWYGLVTSDNGLYVYTKPDYSTRKTDGGVGSNWVVQCLSYTSNGFTKIKYYYGSKTNTFTGYVRSDFLKVYQGKETIPNQVVAQKFTRIYGYTGSVTADWLYVHSSLDFDGNDKKIITAIKKNTKVEIVAKSDKGYKINFQYKGKKTIGYVTKKYIKVSDAMDDLSVTIPSKTMSTSVKTKLKVVDSTKPYALSKKITYSSSKKSVASVTSKGVITAKNPGKATITIKITCGDRTKKLKVKVKVDEYFTLQ